MSRPMIEQTIALAGMFQAASLVDQIARRGMIPQDSFEASINSLFVTSPDCTEDVYGGTEQCAANLQMGLRGLVELSGSGKNEHKDVTRYALSMLHLESRLAKTPQMLGALSDGLQRVRQQARFFDQDNSHQEEQATDTLSFTHPSAIGGLSKLYQDTLSTFSFRIQVTGEPRHLQNNDNADKVRALLLTGIRAAILWKQVGGRRWHLLFFRSRIAGTAQQMLGARK